MKIVGPNQRPPPHPFYGEYDRRGLDPWHKEGFPTELQAAAPRQSAERKSGWFLEDAWGNEIGFVLDGTPFNEANEGPVVVVVKA